MAGTISVVGLLDRKAHGGVVRKFIDRRSPVANPHVMKSEDDRDESCALFAYYIKVKWLVDGHWGEAWPWLQQRVLEYQEGKDIELCCSCRQYADDRLCHGDTLRRLIIYLSSRW